MYKFGRRIIERSKLISLNEIFLEFCSQTYHARTMDTGILLSAILSQYTSVVTQMYTCITGSVIALTCYMSHWKIANFDSPGIWNPWTDRNESLHGWLCLLRHPTYHLWLSLRNLDGLSTCQISLISWPTLCFYLQQCVWSEVTGHNSLQTASLESVCIDMPSRWQIGLASHTNSHSSMNTSPTFNGYEISRLQHCLEWVCSLGLHNSHQIVL